VRLDEHGVLTPQVRRCVPGSVCDGAPSCCRHPCKMPALLLQDVMLLWTVSDTINTLFLVVNLLIY